VKPGDFQQLYEALNKLITDRVLSKRLGQAAWSTVKHKYSMETVTQQYAELFDHISNYHSQGRSSISQSSSYMG
jgi:glycosyltransferase involved in cell wall biosynthesis